MSGVPAAQTCVVSLHVPWPWHGSVGVQLRVVSVETQLNVQSFSQPSPATWLPSSHSSLPVTKPSPHTPGTHTALLQTMFVPHVVPSVAGVPAWQA